MQPAEVTQMLLGWSHGDEEALRKLAPVVYGTAARGSSLYER